MIDVTLIIPWSFNMKPKYKMHAKIDKEVSAERPLVPSIIFWPLITVAIARLKKIIWNILWLKRIFKDPKSNRGNCGIFTMRNVLVVTIAINRNKGLIIILMSSRKASNIKGKEYKNTKDKFFSIKKINPINNK